MIRMIQIIKFDIYNLSGIFERRLDSDDISDNKLPTFETIKMLHDVPYYNLTKQS